LDTFELEHGDRYPGIVRLWRDAWERFIPFLAYPPVIRRIVFWLLACCSRRLRVCGGAIR
jgi:transposase-like protein